MAQALHFPASGGRSITVNLKQRLEEYERQLILAALARAAGNQRRAASELGCLPTTLNEKMKRLGLRACDQLGLGDRPEAEPLLQG